MQRQQVASLLSLILLPLEFPKLTISLTIATSLLLLINMMDWPLLQNNKIKSTTCHKMAPKMMNSMATEEQVKFKQQAEAEQQIRSAKGAATARCSTGY